MAQDAGARLVLTSSMVVLTPELEASTGVVRLDVDDPMVRVQTSERLALEVESVCPAYIMYTSGSTGTPKGVVIPQRAVARLVLNNGYAAFSASDRIAMASNPAFDASTIESGRRC